MNAKEIAHALHGRKSGAGYMACCPAHSDSNPSLSIVERDGSFIDRLLVLHQPPQTCSGGPVL